MLQMKLCGDVVLRTVCAPVDNITPDILDAMDEMVTMMRDQNGVGLAAPQVGILSRFLVMMDPDSETVYKMINPRILSYGSTTCTMEEGCLSVLGNDGLPVYANVTRPDSVVVEWTNEHGEQLTAQMSGLGVLAQNANELKVISGDIANFKNILLGNKQARGAFGERQLEDIVMDIMPPETYSFQHVMPTNVKPDCIIRLPYPPGDMVIDSKFPLESYNRLMENQNDTIAKKQFEQDVKHHIDAIASKYIIAGVTAESAMMFIASESVFAFVHRNFPETIDYAARKKVFLVSPSTLWATLNTIRAVLSDIKIKRVAAKIKSELDTLLTDLARLTDRANNVEKHFRMAQSDIDQLQISIGKIEPRAEKLRSMNFGDD